MLNRSGGPDRSAYEIVADLMREELDERQRAALFAGLVARPVEPGLVTEAVRAVRERMVPVNLPGDPVDTCGTGGSGKRTINTSTLAAFVAAAAGVRVAKHGNRSASGNCGSFDLLEELDVRIELAPGQERALFDETGIVFLFAPLHHPALRLVAPLRRKLGRPTVFNIVGTLCNPAGVVRQLVGTGNDRDALVLAGALQRAGSFGSLVVTGQDGLDEVTVTADTTVRTVGADGIEEAVFSPVRLAEERRRRGAGAVIGSGYAREEEIAGGSPADNSRQFIALAGGRERGARRDLVIVNAAYSLVLAGRVESVEDGLVLAGELLDSGRVLDLFEQYRELSRRV